MEEPSVVGSTQLALLPGGTEDVSAPLGGDGIPLFGDDGFTFLDFLDVINPLQHIPVVSTLYRDLTGDTLDYGSRVAGGALFGGPIGVLASVVNVIFEETTGKDVGEHVMAFFADDSPDDDGTMTAEAVTEADFETAAGGTMSEPDLDIAAWTNPPAAPAQVLAVAPLPPGPPMGAPPADAPPAPAKDDQVLSNRSFLANDAISGLAPQAVDTSPLPPIGAPHRPAAAIKQGAAPSDTMAALLRESEKEADAFAAIRQRTASATPGPGKAAASDAGEATRPVAGAIAAEGGWFSDVMLTALAKYQDSAELARAAPPTVSLTN